jgi:hypothetical protein
MLDNITRSLVRCPKCNEQMKLVEDPPHFALFLPPWRSYRCEPCQIALGYPPDEDEGDSWSELDWARTD